MALTNRDNVCGACGLNFGSVSAFDAHRLGEYPQTGPSEYLDRVRAGLTDEEWRPELGRRCLDEDELEASPKFEPNSYGQWSLAGDMKRARGMREQEATRA